MPSDIRDARLVSRALFGNAAMLDVVRASDRILGAAGTDGTVTTRQTAAALGLSDSVVRPVMIRLVEAGLLTEAQRPQSTNGPRLFHRTRPAAWQGLLSVADELAGVPKALR